MANPTGYIRDYSFTGFQTANPADPLPGDEVDTQLDNISTAISSTQSALADIRRSDGKLQNGIVTADSVTTDFIEAVVGVAEGTLSAIDGYGPDLTHFSSVWLGASAANPTSGPGGAPLTAGMMYYNTAATEYRVYDGTTWQFHTAVSQVDTYFFTATANQQNFYGTDAAGKTVAVVPGALLVSINGIGPLREGTDFVVRSAGNGIDLAEDCAAGDEVMITSFRQLQFTQIGANVADDADRAESARDDAEQARDAAVSLVGAAAYINDKGVLISSQPGANFAQKLAAAQAEINSRGRGYMFLRPTDSFALTQTARIVAGRTPVDFDGADLDASGLTSGYAVELVPGVYADWIAQQQSPIYGLRVTLSDDPATLVDGLFLGQPPDMTSGHTAALSFYELRIAGGRHGVVFGSQTWINTFYNPDVRGQHTSGIYYPAGLTNSGEKIAIKGGVLADVRNDDGTAALIRIDHNADFYLDAVSLDYCDYCAVMTAGMLSGTVHAENNRNMAQFKLTRVLGQEPPKLYLSRSSMSGGPLGDSADPLREPTTGRPVFIQTSGDRIAVGLTDIFWPQFGRPDSYLVDVASGSPMLSLRNILPQVESHKAPGICKATNAVANGGFEGGLNGWTRVQTPVNCIRNSAMVGAVAGSPGTRPSGWKQLGSVPSGVTQTLTPIDVAGKPALLWELTGTPATSGGVGFYFEDASAVAASRGERWRVSVKIQERAPTVGGPISISAAGKNSGGGTEESGGVSMTSGQFYSLTDLVYEIALTDADTAFVQPSLRVDATAGVPLTVRLVISEPTLTLAAEQKSPRLRGDHAGSIPAARYSIDTTVKRSGLQSLKIVGNGENVEFYRDIAVGDSGGILARAYVNVTDHTSGYVLMKIRWLDSRGEEISTQFVGGDNYAGAALSAVTSGFVQRGGQRPPPVGAVTARVCISCEAFTGVAYWDDVEAWAL